MNRQAAAVKNALARLITRSVVQTMLCVDFLCILPFERFNIGIADAYKVLRHILADTGDFR
jgi:hypothetical protein